MNADISFHTSNMTGLSGITGAWFDIMSDKVVVNIVGSDGDY